MFFALAAVFLIAGAVQANLSAQMVLDRQPIDVRGVDPTCGAPAPNLQNQLYKAATLGEIAGEYLVMTGGYKGELFVKWFGSPTVPNHGQDTVNAILDRVSNSNRVPYSAVNWVCDPNNARCRLPTTVAWSAGNVFHQLPVNFNINAGICPGGDKWDGQFNRLQSLCGEALPQNLNVQGATIAHELTHALGGTLDVNTADTYDGALALARTMPNEAIWNAYSYEFFFMEVYIKLCCNSRDPRCLD